MTGIYFLFLGKASDCLKFKAPTQQLTGTKNHFVGMRPTSFLLFIPFSKINLQTFLLILMLQTKLTGWLFGVPAVSADWYPRI